ncbi:MULTISPECIES: class I SAM-dependent methyltransferase [unclassified Arthrobacter]|uniref:class I SAM-dependent methyltransferase n=1 Tax=unclassified Arthrobacter TaxID=235627 RepID=UPI001E3A87E6|nr:MULTISPECIES: class I SAM-dependent methyltransferase [unclassified Arthrobacter]MCC9145568.1 class I SAM-dependent methyltransferase [Arthrobacter sp. zg-Y919]MDK1276797.1 class I SAM-dependent methyltransferase [Arthrobacter sp. zg.Y919]WIB04263.1 class I SAM-dependent methyltransferase [Arthrobacter sp. zg-Y919]
MADELVRTAYQARAAEYTGLLGSVEDMNEVDRLRIEQWADRIGGAVLDVGCGPGHWTDLLHRRGVDVQGMDLVPEFIDSARARFPDVPFRVASFRALGVPDGSLHGVLAWYSLIHVHPDELPAVFSEIARALARGGHLLLGFFEGSAAEPFAHAVTTAYYWSIDQMRQMLLGAGFDVLDVQTRQDPGRRPHAAIAAVVL